MKYALPIWLLAAYVFTANLATAAIDGSFIQLHRGKADKTTEDWRADFRQIKALGGHTVIVQWTVTESVAFFHTSTNLLPYVHEQMPAVERILDAAEVEGIQVLLGLEHQPEYWDQIKGRDKVVSDFLLLRVARNIRAQQALIKAFGNRPAWSGYYIPDEIDDWSWRSPERVAQIRTYLSMMARRLKENDPVRMVAVSAFFRARTAPDLLAMNMADIFEGTGVDVLLLQDGIGVGDPPLAYVSLYYDILFRTWDARANTAQDPDTWPTLWCAVEAFEQTSSHDKPFAAKPAPPERLTAQVEAARPRFDGLILFTYSDYLNPALGDEAREAFEALRSMNVSEGE